MYRDKLSFGDLKEASKLIKRKDCTQNDLMIDGLRISTWYSKGVDHPYIAIDMTHASEYLNLTEEEKTCMAQLAAGYARLLDEMKLCGYGDSEYAAIRDLFENFKPLKKPKGDQLF